VEEIIVAGGDFVNLVVKIFQGEIPRVNEYIPHIANPNRYGSKQNNGRINNISKLTLCYNNCRIISKAAIHNGLLFWWGYRVFLTGGNLRRKFFIRLERNGDMQW
jgi:hypothetical protein